MKPVQKKTSAAVTIFQVVLNVVLCGCLIFMAVKTKDLIDSSFSTDKLSQPMGDMSGGMGGGMGQPGGQTSNVTWSGASEIKDSETLSGQSWSSDTADQNALLIDGEITVDLSDSSITKTGSSDQGDTTSFYGINSALLAKDKAVVTLDGLNVETDAVGGNGIFSFGGTASTQNSAGDGTTINVSNSQITTHQDNSGGIMVTGGGILNASNLTVNTAGVSSAAIRSDRGGGTLKVDGGTYTTTGARSPAVYSTADITVSNAQLISNTSEGVIIEGKNSVKLENTHVEDTNNQLNGQSTTYKNIFLYQSMSGDADTGTAEFESTGSTIITNKGDSFYVTNTQASIDLADNTIENRDSEGNFLRIQKDSWGNEGSNGGTVTMNCTRQSASGNIIVDEISSLVLSLKEGSSLVTAMNPDGQKGKIEVTLSADSFLTLSGDCYLTSFTDEDETYSNIDFNAFMIYVNGQPIVG